MNDPRKTPTKITIAEVSRAARKLQEEKDGDRVISDASAPPLREFALDFEPAYKEQQRRAGSKTKKKEGVLLATIELLSGDPDMDAEAVWANLDDYWVNGRRYFLWIEDDVLVQQDQQTQSQQSIKYTTFVRHYYPAARKKVKALRQ